jgi:hypothetical protein
MNDRPTASAVCAECRRYAEPPFTPLYDLFGTRTPWVVCLDCYDAIMRSSAPPPDAGEGAGDCRDTGGEG